MAQRDRAPTGQEPRPGHGCDGRDPRPGRPCSLGAVSRARRARALRTGSRASRVGSHSGGGPVLEPGWQLSARVNHWAPWKYRCGCCICSGSGRSGSGSSKNRLLQLCPFPPPSRPASKTAFPRGKTARNACNRSFLYFHEKRQATGHSVRPRTCLTLCSCATTLTS